MPILSEKTAIVTGAGGGIGRGIALAIAKEGVAVAVVGRTQSSLDETCALIEAAGGRAMAIRCDVNDSADIRNAIEGCVTEFGGVDFLVNNAQELIYGQINELRDEDYTLLFTSGPLAAFRLMRGCYPHMKKRGGGVVINVVSSTAVMPNPGIFGLYGSVKQCMRTLTRTAACEWARDGIRANSIAPIALTPGAAKNLAHNEEAAKAAVAAIPLGRLGDSEKDIGRAVVFLLGPDSAYITGATVPLDGGFGNFG